MRHIMIFISSILTLSANGQMVPTAIEPIKIEPIVSMLIPSGVVDDISVREIVIDTIPIVEYAVSESDNLQPAFYINGILSSRTRLTTIDPMFVDSIHVEKKEFEIEGKRYFGQIFIKMKMEYNPQIISLNDLIEKYTNIKNELTIFMIDNNFIKDDYDQYLVDEKFLLKIIVDTIERKIDKQNVNIVRLLTKSKENIEKSKEIRLRGLEEITMNYKKNDHNDSR